MTQIQKCIRAQSGTAEHALYWGDGSKTAKPGTEADLANLTPMQQEYLKLLAPAIKAQDDAEPWRHPSGATGPSWEK